MKKVSRKLTLNKQTMALLDEKEMMNVKGGEGDEKALISLICTTISLISRYHCGPSNYCTVSA